MSKDITVNLNTEKNKLHSAAAWVWLYDIDLDSTTWFLTSYDTSITFAGNTYSPHNVSHSALTSDTKGTLESTNVTVSNLDVLIASSLIANDITGRAIRIKRVHVDHLTNSDDVIEQRLEIIDYNIDMSKLKIKAGTINFLKLAFPKDRYSITRCRHTYRTPALQISDSTGIGVLCSYTGAFASCDKTLDGPNGCRVHGDDEEAGGLVRKHPARFGAFPGIQKPAE